MPLILVMEHYDAYNYCDDLTDIISNHDADNPLFIYLPLHNVHTPLQAPDDWLNIYSINSTCKNRRTYQAMVSVADNVTGHLEKERNVGQYYNGHLS